MKSWRFWWSNFRWCHWNLLQTGWEATSFKPFQRFGIGETVIVKAQNFGPSRQNDGCMMHHWKEWWNQEILESEIPHEIPLQYVLRRKTWFSHGKKHVNTTGKAGGSNFSSPLLLIFDRTLEPALAKSARCWWISSWLRQQFGLLLGLVYYINIELFSTENYIQHDSVTLCGLKLNCYRLYMVVCSFKFELWLNSQPKLLQVKLTA